MSDKNDNINKLLDKLALLLKRQDDFAREIDELKTEIYRLKTSDTEEASQTEEDRPLAETDLANNKEVVTTDATLQPQQETNTPSEQPAPPDNKPPKAKVNVEKVIGENLINKIGIAITIIGVAIGAKYSFENVFVNPTTRLFLGYLVGAGLLGFGMKLKQKYENFSAVLVSGAIAIMYFMTFAAYSFHDIIPQGVAFILMLFFTAFAVQAAINYNKQVIAHIGLVGAYAVPFMLSSGSGNITFLFSYIAIINIGILVIAFKKYWKPLYYSSFLLTWIIYYTWYFSKDQPTEEFTLSLAFLTLFFFIFYMTFLAYKLLRKEKFKMGDIMLLLANSFIFYGIGYLILEKHETGQHLLGLFTLCNAMIHFVLSAIIYRQKLADKNLLYFISGLVLVFITIAIPVQLDGNWVTLLWAGEAALLFWIGRAKNVPFCEKLSYPLMILAFCSILHDWTMVYDQYNPERPETRLTPLINTNFLTSLLVISAFGFINFLHRNKPFPSAIVSNKRMPKFFSFFIPAALLFTLYYAFHMEIENYWDQLYADSTPNVSGEGKKQANAYRNDDLIRFKNIWVFNYTLLFVTILSFVNIKKLRNRQLGLINIGFIVITLTAFLIQGLYILSELRESYLEQTLAEIHQRGVFNIVIRYVSFGFVALTLIACYKYIRQDFMKRDFKVAFDLLLHTTILWIASSELIHWVEIVASTQSYKLGLSILWGVYALLLIALGIWKKKKHLRIGAITLFGVTLMKLFFYDISDLDTIAKTIVFVSLGVLLLIISFLYNKYKHIISDDIER